MSIIVCRVNNSVNDPTKSFRIASDSINVMGYTKNNPHNFAYAKMRVLHNKIVVAGAGESSETVLLQNFILDYLEKYSPNRCIINSSVPYVLDLMSNFQKWLREKTGKPEALIENQYFIGFNDHKIYYFNDWFITQINSFHAMGAGADYAMVALDLGHSVEKAIEIAVKYNIYCSGEAQVIDSRLLKS